jgi:hypothetical protein
LVNASVPLEPPHHYFNLSLRHSLPILCSHNKPALQHPLQHLLMCLLSILNHQDPTKPHSNPSRSDHPTQIDPAHARASAIERRMCALCFSGWSVSSTFWCSSWYLFWCVFSHALAADEILSARRRKLEPRTQSPSGSQAGQRDSARARRVTAPPPPSAPESCRSSSGFSNFITFGISDHHVVAHSYSSGLPNL